MLNYYPIQREHQIFRAPALVVTGQKVATPEPFLGIHDQAYEQVTGRTGD
jgi:hypothetical protein